MWSTGEVVLALVGAAMGGAFIGVALASWLAAGARADDRAGHAAALAAAVRDARAKKDEELRVAVELAEKRGYDTGWDTRDLLEKRKRQAAAQQGVATRRAKHGGGNAA